MPRKRKTPYPDDPNKEVKVEMQSSPFPVHGPPVWCPEEEQSPGGRSEEELPPGWHHREDGPPGWHHGVDGPLGRHPGEAASREFQLRSRGNEPDTLNSIGALRTRESNFSSFPRGPPGFDMSNNDARSSPNPSHFPTVPRNPPGFDKSNGFHGVKMIFQESLEITSDRPFLPQRRAPPGVSNISSPSDQIRRRDDQGTRASAAPDDSNAQQTSEGGPRKSLSTGKCPSIRREPPGSPSGGATTKKSAPADNSFESASDVCLKLWKDLGLAMQRRERALRERERNVLQNNINKQALEEEVKQAAAMKNEVMEERRRLEEERRRLEEQAQKIREEKDAMERASTDLAVQMVELQQKQKQIEKEKAAILELKSELAERERRLQEQGGVDATEHKPLRAEMEKPFFNPSNNCCQIADFSSDPGVIPSDGQIQEPDTGMGIVPISMTSAIANDRNSEFVKAEPVHEHESRRNENSSEDDMDDLPLAVRLRKRRVEKTGEKTKSSEGTKHADSNVESSRRAGPQSVGGKSQSYDIHMKRNKVPIEVALQEDAPGLLEQLEERGVLEDMTVYEDGLGMDDSLDMENSGSKFEVLEGVIGKLWGPSAGLGKDLIPVKGQASGNIPRYCLACLLSLIEQTKSLRKRNWPVEWGWCRRLRAFLFVFEKHNRIVLERPEYGYATYFFELVQKPSVDWQVQRLITVMSVATTGRAALLENRPLEVGLHLTHEEATILEDYGWNRSSGLGSLLNFCERVVHDYNKGQEDLGNDWKQKIGKLLMDGLDHGSIVQSIPRAADSFSGLRVKAESA